VIRAPWWTRRRRRGAAAPVVVRFDGAAARGAGRAGGLRSKRGAGRCRARLTRRMDAAVARGSWRGADAVTGSVKRCHDITSYSDIGLAGGCVAGYGDVVRYSGTPFQTKRLVSVADSNMSFWHSAEQQGRQQSAVLREVGAVAVAPQLTRATDKLEGVATHPHHRKQQTTVKSYDTSRRPRPTNEKIVHAHTGKLIRCRVAGLIGASVLRAARRYLDWNDSIASLEIAFFDAGPGRRVMGPRIQWYNGVIVVASAEPAMALEVHETPPVTVPAPTQKRIDDGPSGLRVAAIIAGKQVNIVWPSEFALSSAYVDQLERNGGCPALRVNEAGWRE